MRLRATTAWMGLVLVGAATAQSAPSIDLFGVNATTGQVDFARCQGSVVPGGEPLRLSIYARLGGLLQELSGAEFFVYERGPNGEDRNNIFVPVAQGGLGWSVSVVPNPLAFATTGNPFLETGTPPNTDKRAQIAFMLDQNTGEGCQRGDADSPPGMVKLYDVTIQKTTTGNPIPDDTYLWVGPGAPPGSPNFQCPLFLRCDIPTTGKSCVAGGQFIVNPASRDCSVAVAPKPWGSIKALYR